MTDGSEDGDVHCLKDGGVAEDARVAIDRDDSDPFEEEEDISWRRSMTAS